MAGFLGMRATRNNVTKKEKEAYLSMPVEEKRKHYKCGKDYVDISQILTWPEYYQRNKARLDKLGQHVIPIGEPDDELNNRVSIWKGDITTLEIDAIVNAANESLLGGGGVDGAIHRAAGSQLKAECAKLGGCQTGDAKITCGYKLPAKHVIHTVGPIGENESKLRSCYQTCLDIIRQKSLLSVAFPCISTGIYGYPNERAAPVALTTARDWLQKSRPDRFSRIIFCLFLPKDVELYETLMQKYFPIAKGDEKPKTSSKLSEEEDSHTAKAPEKCDTKDNKKVKITYFFGHKKVKKSEDKEEETERKTEVHIKKEMGETKKKAEKEDTQKQKGEENETEIKKESEVAKMQSKEENKTKTTKESEKEVAKVQCKEEIREREFVDEYSPSKSPKAKRLNTEDD